MPCGLPLSGLVLTALVAASQTAPPSVLSLAGSWEFRLDPQNVGVEEGWQRLTLPDTIALPGTTDLAGYGETERAVDRGHLVRAHSYVGAAWYRRDITIPAAWAGKRVELLLERCLWQTRVWIDGRIVGEEHSLCTPHRHDLGELEPGTHTVAVRVDNSLIVNIGTMGHSYTEETQSIWNGIVGRIELRAHDSVWIRGTSLFADPATKLVRAEVAIRNDSGASVKGEAACRVLRDGEPAGGAQATFTTDATEGRVVIEVPLRGAIEWWDEWTPVLYEAEISLAARSAATSFADRATTSFGFRALHRAGRAIQLKRKIRAGSTLSARRAHLLLPTTTTCPMRPPEDRRAGWGPTGPTGISRQPSKASPFRSSRTKPGSAPSFPTTIA
ncbi:MAG: sugar-binding domain-containing protein [Planctomycetota bacterium]